MDSNRRQKQIAKKKLEGFEASIKTRLHVNVYVDVDFIIALLELNGWITLNRTGVAPPTDDKIEFHPSLKNTSSSAIENSIIKMPNQLNEDQKKEVKAIYLKSLSYFQNTPHYPKNFTAFRNSVAQLCVVKKNVSTNDVISILETDKLITINENKKIKY